MIKNKDISQILYDSSVAKDQLGDILIECGLNDWSDLGWDHYDDSLEIYGVDPDFRFEDTSKIMECGFIKIFVNHTDGWETHYNDADPKGWRVFYTNKQTLSETQNKIYVEEHVDTWPQEWYDTGYVEILKKEKK